MNMTLFPGFEERRVDVGAGIEIAASIGGSGPPLLLLHGYPQTRAIWHRVAPALAQRHTLVAADLRGHGDSSKPVGTSDHGNYAKRAMANDQAALMRGLGFDRFDVLAHDRGARVAHRLAVDHAEAVKRLIVLDIAPTLAMYEQTNEVFARAYWHWFFLIQPAPMPERMIGVDTVAYLHELMGRGSAGLTPFDPRAMAEYERCLALPGAVHSTCEDYRAAAGIDLIHDRADRDAGRMLDVPMLVLWGEHGAVQRCFEPLKEWRRVARDVRGESLPCGHYIAEEVPDAMLSRVLPFLS
jgi:haloacetate dehalogenase